MASESTVYASTDSLGTISSEADTAFNPNRNTRSVAVKDISISIIHEFSSEDSLSPIVNAVKNNHRVIFYSDAIGITYVSEVKDHRKRITRFLYPFHFFW